MNVASAGDRRKQYANEDTVNDPKTQFIRALPRSSGAIPREEFLASEYLEARGSSLKDFENAGCEIVASANHLDPVFPAAPALVFNFFDPWTGDPLTFADKYGVDHPFQRIRPLGTRGAKFLQPKESGTHVYFAPHANLNWGEVLNDPSFGLVLSEGETRSLAGATNDLAVISVTGVDCGQVEGNLHPDLERVSWRGRDLFMAFDSDVVRKPDPRRALEHLAGLLQQRGANVFEVRLPANPDGSKQGLDDFLARHGAGAFKALLNSPETTPMAGAETYEPPVSLRDLMATAYPPTEWVWNNFVLKGEVNLLFGDGGVGKSLLALKLGVHVAAGKQLFEEATIQMPVLAFFAEDSASQVQQRVTTILIDGGLDANGDLPIKLWCQPRGESALATIAEDGSVTELPRLHALRAELAELAQPALLIVDSLADLFALNESLRLPVNAALKQVLGGLCRDFGATVLVLAHPSKASMLDGSHYSGSTAFNNAVRQRLTLEISKPEPGTFHEGPPPRTLKVAKSNYGATGEKTLWFYGATIEALPRALPDDGRASAFHRAVVDAAIAAASLNLPCNRKTINGQVFEAAKKVLGRRPSASEVHAELQKAVSAGELRFMEPSSKRAAGYYPPDEAEAVALSLNARKARFRPTTSSEAGE